MIITQKHINRRAMLRGAGAALALPILDSMVPALAASIASSAQACPIALGVDHPFATKLTTP